MKRWLSSSVRLWLLVSLSGCLSVVAIEPGWAEVKSASQRDFLTSRLKAGGNVDDELGLGNPSKIRQLSELEIPVTSAQQLLVQSPTPQTTPASTIIQITAVKANPIEQGVEVILETTQAQQLQVVNRSSGNSYIVDIPNAQLRLHSGDAFTFRSQKPVAGITEITVTNEDTNTIRVTVTGEAGVPKVELFDSPEEGLIFGIASATASSPQGQQPPTPPTPQEQPGSETQPSEPSAENRSLAKVNSKNNLNIQ